MFRFRFRVGFKVRDKIRFRVRVGFIVRFRVRLSGVWRNGIAFDCRSEGL